MGGGRPTRVEEAIRPGSEVRNVANSLRWGGLVNQKMPRGSAERLTNSSGEKKETKWNALRKLEKGFTNT